MSSNPLSNATRRSSRLPGFYRLRPQERVDALVRAGFLTRAQADAYAYGNARLPRDVADSMIENVIGTFDLPVGLGVNFVINDVDYVVPMVVEEPSIVAAVSHTAAIVRRCGGFSARADQSIMTGQVQVIGVDDLHAAKAALQAHEAQLVALANAAEPNMLRRGGGAVSLDVRDIDGGTPRTRMLIAHLHVDTCDAMGANLVNTMCEAVAGEIEKITGGVVALRILTNLTDRRRVQARCVIPVEELAWQEFSGADVAEGIVNASAFAESDPYRASTHNKGIMNGIDAVAIATGQDWRAIEAGAHAFAAIDGAYRPLARWSYNKDGHIVGELDMPMAVGVVGGPIRLHPMVRAHLDILGVTTAAELACVMGAVGLAQNLAAIKALGSTGIQRGHMALHARSVAATAGAVDGEVAWVAEQLVSRGEIKVELARAIVDDLRQHNAALSAAE